MTVVLQISLAGASRSSRRLAETGSSVPPCSAGSGAESRGGSTETLTGVPSFHSIRLLRSARGDLEVAVKSSGTTLPPEARRPEACPSKKKSVNIPTTPAVSMRVEAL